MADGRATPYRVTVYATKDEFWPWWDLSVEPDRFNDRKGDVPAELWERYLETSRAYWKLKQEILDAIGVGANRG